MKPYILLSATGLAVAVLSGSAQTKPLDQQVPDGTATFSTSTVQVGLGYSWGQGKLVFQGRSYPFKVKGVSAVGLGAETTTGTADIYHLKTASELTGVYGATGVGGSVGTSGGGTAILQNAKGVIIRLHAKDRGLDINLAVSGVDISMAPI